MIHRGILYTMKLPRFIVGKNTTDMRRNSLNVPPENVLSLRKKDDFKIEINLTGIKNFFTKNKKLVGPLSILALTLIIFMIATKGKASIVNFYPESCLGGWENPSNASGQPSVASDAQGSDFTRDNSAFLKNRTSQIFCGDFGGEVPQDSIPRKFTVRFSWFVDDGSYDKGEKIINDALDDGRTSPSIFEDISSPSGEHNQDDGNGSSEQSIDDGGSVDVTIDDSPLPSNEDGSSDLPAGESSPETSTDGNDSTSSSASQDSGGGNSGGSSKGDGGSDSSSGGDGSSGDSSGGDSGASSGGEGAFLEKLFNKAFAQESETQRVNTSTESVEVQNATADDSRSTTSSEDQSESTDSNKDVLIENGSSESNHDTTNNTQDASSESVVEENSQSEDAQEISNTSEEVSVDESARDDLFRVMYTIDGEKWEELGLVKRNNWKNVEFEIPFSSVDSWEKLSKVQIAIESLPTIDSFPEAYLDSVWVSVEYEGVNPDPLPQPDFLNDKVLNDIRYENFRVIRIMKTDGEFQIWYAIIPPELLAQSGAQSDEVIKTGDDSLQVIDVSNLPNYDPTIGPEQNMSVSSSTEENATEKTPTIEALPQDSNQEVLGEMITEGEVQSGQEYDNTVNNVVSGEKIIPPISLPDVSIFESTDKEQDSPQTDSDTQKPLNEDILKKEGEKTDLQELNQPLWYWNLIARGESVHSEIDIAVDNYGVFWINDKINTINMFGMSSSGSYLSISFEGQQVGTLSFVAPSGIPRYARFNTSTKTFVFSDE